MGRYFITGRQGAGKSSVIRELQKRGYTAYDTDALPGVTRLQVQATGETVDWPDGYVDWSTHAWNWYPDKIAQLLASDETVFIGAVVGNQSDFYPLFDVVFALTVETATLAAHLASHEHGYDDFEINRILTNHPLKQPRYIAQGAIPISNDGPLTQTVDQILSHIHA